MPARQRAIGSSQQPIAIDDSDDGVTREPLPDHLANTGRTERFPAARARRGGEPTEDSDDSSVVDVKTFRRRHARASAGQSSQAERKPTLQDWLTTFADVKLSFRQPRQSRVVPKSAVSHLMRS